MPGVSAMENIVEAIFEGGIFRPTSPVSLPEGERVSLTITESNHASGPATADLEAWQSVFAGLSDEDLATVEAHAARSPFFDETEL